MRIRAEDVHSLTDFRQHAATHLERLAQSGGAEILTVNGQARGVVMAPTTFDRLMELAGEAEVARRLRAELSSAEAGEVTAAADTIRAIARERDIPLDS